MPYKSKHLDWHATRKIYQAEHPPRLLKRHKNIALCYFLFIKFKRWSDLHPALLRTKRGATKPTRKPAIHKRKFMGQKGPAMLNRSPLTQHWTFAWAAHPQFNAYRRLQTRLQQHSDKYDANLHYNRHDRRWVRNTLGHNLTAWSFFAPRRFKVTMSPDNYINLIGASQPIILKTILKWRHRP